ncbi:MAG: hypothetical protein HGA36_01695 [Candidatus Moranbacteria bacterium]|nr:hypothetical protein [Candidatus Moranbacteria bacterium]
MSAARSLSVHKKPYKSDFLCEVLVVIFGGRRSVSENEGYFSLHVFAEQNKWSKRRCSEIMEYLLKRKFFRVSGERLIVAQAKLQSLNEHRKNVADFKSERVELKISKARKIDKKKAKSLAAKVVFDENVAMILVTIFGEDLKAGFSNASMQTWTFDLMCSFWHHVKCCVNQHSRQPTQKQVSNFIEKMKKVGLIEERVENQKTFVCLTQKGAVYCGLQADDCKVNKLSKHDKFSRQLDIIKGDVCSGVNGLRSLKKQVKRLSECGVLD